MVTDEAYRLAERIWNYHRLGHELRRSDVILVLGSHDLRVAERGAELFLEGWAPCLLMSGGLGNLTRGKWDEPEAVKFKRRALSLGVPADRILVEPESTNTGENLLFSERTLRRAGIRARRFLLVQKPYMERRAFAAFRKLWPRREVVVTSPRIEFKDYPTPEIPLELVISIMVGDLQRILLYPERGYQIPQEVPPHVVAAYERLVEMGFTGHLLKE